MAAAALWLVAGGSACGLEQRGLPLVPVDPDEVALPGSAPAEPPPPRRWVPELPRRFAGPYALDEVDRSVPATGPVTCPEVETVRYRGEVLRYQKPVRVHPEFKERLLRFEAVARAVAEEVYGRAPVRVQHLGAFNCRRVNRTGARLSEHGLGNALDVAGFDFGPMPRRAVAPEGLPAALRRGFEVRVAKHWATREGGKGADVALVHARFLRTLRARLAERDDVFRRIIGPPRAGHHDHFHFDNGPALGWGW